jgi:putative colanic acid biosynthesis UDP-glucose lipid carrier transferase
VSAVLATDAGSAQTSWVTRFDRSLRAKRYMDVLASLVLLILLSPVLALVAAAIRWDSPGPVLITQKRNGLNKREFRIFKFRSMHVVEDGHAAVQCRRNDPRLTRIGAFLRRLNLDELPQLVNVLKGEMSLVGPRPHPTVLDREFAKYVPEYERRFAAVPGITGLAQVRGYHGPVETRAQIWNRVAADVEYAEKRTLIGDIGILARTIAIFLSLARNA